MDLGNDLVHIVVGPIRNERLMSVGRKQKREEPVFHREQGISLHRRVKLEIRLLVIGPTDWEGFKDSQGVIVTHCSPFGGYLLVHGCSVVLGPTQLLG